MKGLGIGARFRRLTVLRLPQNEDELAARYAEY